MIKVTVMVWFKVDNEPRFREFQTEMSAADTQWAAEQYADVNKGQCKIFNDATSQVVGSAGF